jgi:hypothetical protein
VRFGAILAPVKYAVQSVNGGPKTASATCTLSGLRAINKRTETSIKAVSPPTMHNRQISVSINVFFRLGSEGFENAAFDILTFSQSGGDRLDLNEKP